MENLTNSGLPRSFIKRYGVTKKAWREYRKTLKSRRTTSDKRGRKLTRRRTRRKTRRKKRTIPLIPILSVAGPIVYEAKRAWDAGWGVEGVIDNISQIYTGFSFVNQTFDINRLKNGLVPALVGIAAHKALNMLGVNRMFNNLPAPLNKLRL